MNRWVRVLVPTLAIALLGADAPPSGMPQSVTILNASDASGSLEPLQRTFVSAKVASALDAAGLVIARVDDGVRTLEKEGSVVCAEVSTPLILVRDHPNDGERWRAVGNGEYNSVQIELGTYDCVSHAIKRVTGSKSSSFSWTDAASKSIADVVKRYLTGAPSAR